MVKLALLTDHTASCILCEWNYTARSRKKEITQEELKKIAHKSLLEHLRSVHSRWMVSVEEKNLKRSGIQILTYHGPRYLNEI